MAQSTTVEGFPVPLASHSGWRTANDSDSTLGHFVVSRFGEVKYRDYYVGADAVYGAAVLAAARAQTSTQDFATQAAAEIAALEP